ncbi:MAG: hypothetical protein A2583_02950 [Bdellovibrionales bacterium RIFOXYD1_FULL_53_11]|nr:MAG: hypothetical protein A2583_02950 [Bdellovibrionales bacterium RIFOXYD1_FULL_53_11]
MAQDNKTYEPLINPDDFNSIQTTISIMNVTTRMEIKPKKFGPEEIGIKLIEFMGMELVFEIPANSCAPGHNVLIHIEATGPDKKKVQFNTTAKVTELEDPGDNRHTIKVSLLQYDEMSYNDFNSLFSSRQQEIEEFFNGVKGR